MTQRELNAQVKFLVKELKLDGWKIKGRLVDKIETEGAVADTGYQPEWKVAEFDILHPHLCIERQMTFRQALIHELLHILFEGHKPLDGPYDPAVEFAINATSLLLDKLLPGETNG